MKLPTLFKKTSTGAQQQWTISVEDNFPIQRGDVVEHHDNVIVTRFGQTGGAIQTTADVIKEGKNIGKKNETTARQQAELEAQAKWELKKKKNLYVEDAEGAMAGAVDELVEGGLSPMLAHRYDEHGHKIVFPAKAQPKLDGHRCIVIIKDGKASMWTRTRKPIPGLPHIVRAFEELVEGDAVFDGELYNHDYRNKFEDLTSFIRQQKPKEGHEVVEYHVYDSPGVGGGFGDRVKELELFFDVVDIESPIKMVETIHVADEDELMVAFERFLKQGYEGAMVRNILGEYVGKRSYDLLKVKEFIDGEFEVVGVVEGRGKLAGHGIFVCQMEDGQKFQAKMMGELGALKKYVTNPKLAVGKQITVKYQGLTKANGVPRFPVAVRFREEA